MAYVWIGEDGGVSGQAWGVQHDAHTFGDLVPASHRVSRAHATWGEHGVSHRVHPQSLLQDEALSGKYIPSRLDLPGSFRCLKS